MSARRRAGLFALLIPVCLFGFFQGLRNTPPSGLGDAGLAKDFALYEAARGLLQGVDQVDVLMVLHGRVAKIQTQVLNRRFFRAQYVLLPTVATQIRELDDALARARTREVYRVIFDPRADATVAELLAALGGLAEETGRELQVHQLERGLTLVVLGTTG